MRRQGGEGVSRRVSNSADLGKPGQNRYERPMGSREVDEATVDLANFRAISLTVSTFFKQVCYYYYGVSVGLLSIKAEY